MSAAKAQTQANAEREHAALRARYGSSVRILSAPFVLHKNNRFLGFSSEGHGRRQARFVVHNADTNSSPTRKQIKATLAPLSMLGQHD